MTIQYTFSGICKGLTKSGKPCGQKSIYLNGYCRHHGGETPQSYIDAQIERIREKEARRTARLERKLRRIGVLDTKDRRRG